MSSSPNNNNNNINNNINDNKIEERRREADLARMKEEIVREVREEVIFTFFLKNASHFHFFSAVHILLLQTNHLYDVLGIKTKDK